MVGGFTTRNAPAAGLTISTDKEIEGMSNKRFRLAYILSFVVGLSTELWAVLNRKHGDTFTEMTRPALKRSAFIRWTSFSLFLAVATWLGFHFWFE